MTIDDVDEYIDQVVARMDDRPFIEITVNEFAALRYKQLPFGLTDPDTPVLFMGKEVRIVSDKELGLK